jgi:hypothetical protein
LTHDPDEFHDVAPGYPDLVRRFEELLLERFRGTHPEARSEPTGLALEGALDFYLRPSDA